MLAAVHGALTAPCQPRFLFAAGTGVPFYNSHSRPVWQVPPRLKGGEPGDGTDIELSGETGYR